MTKSRTMRIKTKDIKVRRSWGGVKPYTRKHPDLKKEEDRKICRKGVDNE